MPIAPVRIERQHLSHEIEENPLEQLVSRQLIQSGYRQLASVACRCDEETVVLSGRVSSYYMKQAAQETVRKLGRGLRVDNRVQVVSSRS